MEPTIVDAIKILKGIVDSIEQDIAIGLVDPRHHEVIESTRIMILRLRIMRHDIKAGKWENYLGGKELSKFP